MAYYVRIFCKDKSCPSLDELELSLKRDNAQIRFDSDECRTSRTWSHAEFYYKDGKDPIIVEIAINEGPESLAAMEPQEFLYEIGKPGISLAKRKVIKHLTRTHYIVSCQLLNDIDEDGYHLNGELGNYFVKNHAGLFQADGEGFYDGHKLIVELPY